MRNKQQHSLSPRYVWKIVGLTLLVLLLVLYKEQVGVQAATTRVSKRVNTGTQRTGAGNQPGRGKGRRQKRRKIVIDYDDDEDESETPEEEPIHPGRITSSRPIVNKDAEKPPPPPPKFKTEPPAAQLEAEEADLPDCSKLAMSFNNKLDKGSLGMRLKLQNRVIVIKSIKYDTLAATRAVRSGDIITRINDTPILDMQVNDVADLITKAREDENNVSTRFSLVRKRRGNECKELLAKEIGPKYLEEAKGRRRRGKGKRKMQNEDEHESHADPSMGNLSDKQSKGARAAEASERRAKEAAKERKQMEMKSAAIKKNAPPADATLVERVSDDLLNMPSQFPPNGLFSVTIRKGSEVSLGIRVDKGQGSLEGFLVVGEITEHSDVWDKAGVKVGDIVWKINGHGPLNSYPNLKKAIESSKTSVECTFQRSLTNQKHTDAEVVFDTKLEKIDGNNLGVLFRHHAGYLQAFGFTKQDAQYWQSRGVAKYDRLLTLNNVAMDRLHILASTVKEFSGVEFSARFSRGVTRDTLVFVIEEDDDDDNLGVGAEFVDSVDKHQTAESVTDDDSGEKIELESDSESQTATNNVEQDSKPKNEKQYHSDPTNTGEESKEQVVVDAGIATGDDSVEAATSEDPVEAATSEDPVEVETSKDPVEVATSEDTVEAATSEDPVEVETSKNPVEVATSEDTVEAATSEDTVEAATSEDTVEAATSEDTVETETIEDTIEVETSEGIVETETNEDPVETETNEDPVEAEASEDSAKVESISGATDMGSTRAHIKQGAHEMHELDAGLNTRTSGEEENNINGAEPLRENSENEMNWNSGQQVDDVPKVVVEETIEDNLVLEQPDEQNDNTLEESNDSLHELPDDVVEPLTEVSNDGEAVNEGILDGGAPGIGTRNENSHLKEQESSRSNDGDIDIPETVGASHPVTDKVEDGKDVSDEGTRTELLESVQAVSTSEIVQASEEPDTEFVPDLKLNTIKADGNLPDGHSRILQVEGTGEYEVIPVEYHIYPEEPFTPPPATWVAETSDDHNQQTGDALEEVDNTLNEKDLEVDNVQHDFSDSEQNLHGEDVVVNVENAGETIIEKHQSITQVEEIQESNEVIQEYESETDEQDVVQLSIPTNESPEDNNVDAAIELDGADFTITSSETMENVIDEEEHHETVEEIQAGNRGPAHTSHTALDPEHVLSTDDLLDVHVNKSETCDDADAIRDDEPLLDETYLEKAIKVVDKVLHPGSSKVVEVTPSGTKKETSVLGTLGQFADRMLKQVKGTVTTDSISECDELLLEKVAEKMSTKLMDELLDELADRIVEKLRSEDRKGEL